MKKINTTTEEVPSISILSLNNVYKTLSGKEILHGVSLEVLTGEIFGFLGPNGAGKTTTMKCILGLLEPEAGELQILGSPELTREIRHHIGFMPENTYLYKYLTGREFLRFNGKFFDIPKEELEDRIDTLIQKVGLEHAQDKLLAQYSKGMLQRIGLAQAIINRPKIVFLDEPMSGLDPVGRKMVKDLMLELKAEGTTIFFNTHILSDVESICDHFAIIHFGKIVANQKVSDLTGTLEDYFMEVISKTKEGIGDVI
ncbi:MAG: ABC transporter ATP-binding protein [Candidatus Gracilibacteria bacterium]|nr:ABC transporter ATP-binding protein [Candidatus Gracilibacteria bacterium]